MKTNDFKEIVLNRRSRRKYDPTVKITHEEMKEMLNAATRAPSSVNMQPWRFVVIESADAKEKLRPLIRFNTVQNDTSAAMILILGDLQSFTKAEEIYQLAVDQGGMSAEVKAKQMAGITREYQAMLPQKNRDNILIDGGMVAMQLMLVARAYGYDTNPIGGFERREVLTAFGLNPDRLVPVVILSIGKAVDEGYQTVRLPIDELTQWR